MLPREDLLKGGQRSGELAGLIDLAERALRTWEPCWSGFLDPELAELAEQRLGSLTELRLGSAGGWPQAERRCLLLQRAELDWDEAATPDLMGLVMSGNFLFDPAEPEEMRQGLLETGVGPEQLGDLWLRGDRGAQLVLSGAAVPLLQGRSAQVRSVEVQLEAVPLSALQLPASRSPRELSSVEASRRLDAVASAGFGLARSRMAERIRAGAVRVNWQGVTSPSRELQSGDRIRLDGRGELEILAIEPTKRDRWRVRLLRR